MKKTKYNIKYYCKNPENNPDCKGEIHYRTAINGTELCTSCCQIGKKRSKETCKKISKANKKTWQNGKLRKKLSKTMKGKNIYKRSEEHKRKISKAMKGKNNPRYLNGKCLKTYYCKMCKKKIGIGSGVYGSGLCTSCSLKGKNKGKKNGMFGKITIWKREYYKNIWMRSSWEVKYAKYLDRNKIKWKYEPKTFDLGNMTYTPDFYLPKTKAYVEIKGYFSEKNKKKMKKFVKLYPKIKLKLLREKHLQNLGIKI